MTGKMTDQLIKQAISYANCGDIDNFSGVEHKLSTNIYLKETDDEDDFFDKYYLIQSLSRVCLHQANLLEPIKKNQSYKKTERKEGFRAEAMKWLIIWKGPFRLAHIDYLKEFIYGLKKTKIGPLPHIVCLDQKMPNEEPFIGLTSINLYKLKTPKEKLLAYKEIARQFDLAIWVASSQNSSLYMGNRFCKREAFWTMKHLKIRPGSIDLLLCGGHHKGIRRDGPTYWQHGTSSPFSLRTRFKEIEILSKERKMKNDLKFTFGVGVREEKLSNKNYIIGIIKILKKTPSSRFMIATSMDRDKLINYFREYTSDDDIISRVVQVGWIKEEMVAKFLSLIDCYVDTYPMGSGLMGMYTTFLKGTYIGLNCRQTNNSSFIGALRDYAMERSIKDLSLLGIAGSYEHYVKLAIYSYERYMAQKDCNIQRNQYEYAKSVCKNLENYQMAKDFWGIIQEYMSRSTEQ